VELELRDISVWRAVPDAPPALDGVTLQIAAGERIAIMGANGAGKSTLALVMAGALRPTRGRIDGAARAATRAVLQRPEASFLAERVLDEVALGATWNGAARADAERVALGALHQLGLDSSIADRDPLALSGGEQRRVAIAAAVATAPRVIILDEPSAGLDAAARHALLDSIARLHGEGRTVITITHDADEAARVADRLLVLQSGRLTYDGPIDAVLGDPEAARALGLVASPEVRVLRALAQQLAREEVRLTAHPDRALAAARQLYAAAAPTIRRGAAPAVPDASPSQVARPVPAADPRAGLAPSVDARLRIPAAVVVMAAALLATSLVAAAIVAGVVGAAVLAAPLARAHARVVVRPIITITVMLVLLQYAFGRHVDVTIIAGTERSIPLAVALHRALQIASVLLTSLLLTTTTTAQDIGAALRWFLAPLRLLRVPVDDVALVIATALAILPTLDAELGRIRTARSARGIRLRSRTPLARVRYESLVLMPLLVTSFGRARLLADALVVRGVDPRGEAIAWRPRRIPPADLAALLSAMILVLVARFI
jgi:energy-coupling factor transporter ATP-binding protein EcfA2/energy-coupling factor transporter transmembrane protein EcfT